MGVAVKDLGLDEAYFINPDELFPVASTIKVAILIEFFNRVEKGTLNPLEPVLYKAEHKTIGSGVLKELTPGSVSMPLIDHATLMMTVSDNTSTNLLMDTLGIDRINSGLSDLGLVYTRLTRKMMDIESLKAGKDSFTTPREIARLFEFLYRNERLSKYVCDETIRMLKKPKEGIISGVIRNAVPSEIQVADKSGWVDGATLDAGIVYQPRHPYIVAVLMKHEPKYDLHHLNALETMTRATKLIHRYFEEVSSSTIQGRKLPP